MTRRRYLNHRNRYLFTGRRFDIETGLYHYRLRYYNAYIGRLLRTDPIGYGDGINWYRCSANNPLAGVGLYGEQASELTSYDFWLAQFNESNPDLTRPTHGEFRRWMEALRGRISAFFDNPLVYVGWDEENGDRYTMVGHVGSRADLYGTIYSSGQFADKIVYLGTIGHGFDGLLTVGAGRDIETVTRKLAVDVSTLSTRKACETRR